MLMPNENSKLSNVDKVFSSSSSISSLPTTNPIPSWWQKEYSTSLTSHGKTSPLPKEVIDVVIIGSGLSGISSALSLINQLTTTDIKLSLKDKEKPRESFGIVVMEAREFCSGATGRNGGHLISSAFLGFKSLSERFSQEEALRAVKLEEKSIADTLEMLKNEAWTDAVDLVEGGNVHLFSTEQEKEALSEEIDAAKKAGCDVSHIEWITPQAASEQFGTARTLTGALKLPGNNLFPIKLVTQMYKLAHQKATASGRISLELYTHTPVIRVFSPEEAEYPRNGKVDWTIETPRGTFSTHYVIHATNAYASYLLPQHQSNSDHAIVPTRAQVIAVRPAKQNDGKAFWTNGFSANEGFDYFFQRPSNEKCDRPLIILGGGRNRSPPDYEFGISDDSSLNEHVGNYLRNFLPGWFSNFWNSIKDVDVVAEWTGIMGFTKDHDPIIGPVIDQNLIVPGQFILAGYSGHGMSRAPVCAEAVAQMIISQIFNTKWYLPSWLPKHYLSTYNLDA
ncbi:hypothetical protein CROQUDRAFT_721215 [Cronartium quercuum f. sp. fusiforme G11]|uniref:FAD dependent oxidoreductase domain-containing protein n=1 Tax=Cronartium quercuum f. sp. fusiforme G11 TaxID=708437 RepID=A0A9P6NL85_9BASI|nr:hypothetical protein CROQUDRAFT_721215 [Cronartium quercuum f. sp. fusiforme G11]